MHAYFDVNVFLNNIYIYIYEDINNLSVCNKYGKKYTWKNVVFINLSNRIRKDVKIRVFCIFMEEKYPSIYINQ